MIIRMPVLRHFFTRLALARLDPSTWPFVRVLLPVPRSSGARPSHHELPVLFSPGRFIIVFGRLCANDGRSVRKNRPPQLKRKEQT